MTVFSTTSCAMCNMLISRMKEKGLDFEISHDTDVMAEKGITTVPILMLDDGTMLGLRQALRYVEEGAASV